jgi:hypothetical protein
MFGAEPLSGADLPRRRRAPGRESTLRLGDEDEAGGRGAAPRPLTYPPEPPGGGFFGPDPTQLMSQKERLAAERKVRARLRSAPRNVACCLRAGAGQRALRGR